MEHGHRTVERRSIALHRLVAERLDDAITARARGQVAGWLRDGGPVPRPAALAWREALDGPREALRELLVADDERSRDLRQNTPFAGVVEPRERWRVLRDVR